LAPYCFQKGKNSTRLPVEDQKRYNREILYHYPISLMGFEEGDVAIYMSERCQAEMAVLQ
jgi:hypothetical protein